MRQLSTHIPRRHLPPQSLLHWLWRLPQHMLMQQHWPSQYLQEKVTNSPYCPAALLSC